MTAAVRDQQLTVVGAVVYNSYDARLFTAETTTHQRIHTSKIIERSGKSEAEVIPTSASARCISDKREVRGYS